MKRKSTRVGTIKRPPGGHRNSVFSNFLGMANVSGSTNLRVSSSLDNSVDESLGSTSKVDGKEEEDDGKYVSKYFMVIRFSTCRYTLMNSFSRWIIEGNKLILIMDPSMCFHIDLLMKMQFVWKACRQSGQFSWKMWFVIRLYVSCNMNVLLCTNFSVPGIFKYLNEDISTKLYEDDESQEPVGPVKVRRERKKEKRLQSPYIFR